MTYKKMLKDKSFQKYLSKRNMQEITIKSYAVALNQYCKINNIKFHEFIKEQRIEQRSRIENNIIVEYDPNYGIIDTYQEKFVETLRERGNKDTTIKAKLKQVNSIFKSLKIKTPDFPQFEDDSDDWYSLTESDIKYLLDITSVKYNALIQFMVSTGFRTRDIINFKIKDYINATKEYHDFTEIDDFLANASDDWFGFWDFDPHKTKKYKIRVKTFNSPASNKMILLMLRERQKKLNKKGLKLSTEDYLFSSQMKNNKGQMVDNAVSIRFQKLNKLLQEEKKRVITKKYEDEEISKETYDELISKFPKFHPHGLRKYYITMIAMSCSNPRVISFLEGHTSLLATDPNYVDMDAEDMNDVIKEEYLKVLPNLTFDDTIIDFTLLRKKEALEAENKKLQLENQRIKEEIADEVHKQIQEQMLKSYLTSQQKLKE